MAPRVIGGHVGGDHHRLQLPGGVHGARHAAFQRARHRHHRPFAAAALPFFEIFTQIMTLCAMAYFDATRKWIGLVAIALLCFGGLFTGARGPFVFFAFQFFVLYAISPRCGGSANH